MLMMSDVRTSDLELPWSFITKEEDDDKGEFTIWVEGVGTFKCSEPDTEMKSKDDFAMGRCIKVWRTWRYRPIYVYPLAKHQALAISLYWERQHSLAGA
jgi:hypothetical protein